MAVFHTTGARRPECRESNPEKLRPRDVAPKGGERGVPIVKKNVVDILEGQTLKRWRRRFDGRQPKSSNGRGAAEQKKAAEQLYKQQE